jgi:deoxyribodipyrimidine photo-lyase
MTVAIWWIRRDLRLSDNTALYNALTASPEKSVIPLFIFDPTLLGSARCKGYRLSWLLEGLAIFRADIEAIGGRLILKQGDPVNLLPTLATTWGVSSVHYQRDYSPYAKRRDQAVESALQAVGIACHAYKDLVIHESAEVKNKSQQPYSVYSPYRKVWESLPKPPELPAPRHFSTPELESDPLPTPESFGVQPAPQPIVSPGEKRGLDRLEYFTQRIIFEYDTQRDLPNTDGTSLMSPYLRWGMVSPRQAYWAGQDALRRARTADETAGVERWINELVWREFFYQVLERNPHIVKRSYRPEFDRIAWENNADHFEAWKAGQTGYPIVDAAMRQLNQTGWMHNRTRMIVASFLCKDLLIDWRWGEAYFMEKLIDGDLANNNGGWQWTAGTGTDAAPYFRVFNPHSQSERVDANGGYIKRWLPELKRVPKEYIHAPHTMPMAVQAQFGVMIGRDYPMPLVAHDVQRERALALYSVVKRYER